MHRLFTTPVFQVREMLSVAFMMLPCVMWQPTLVTLLATMTTATTSNITTTGVPTTVTLTPITESQSPFLNITDMTTELLTNMTTNMTTPEVPTMTRTESPSTRQSTTMTSMMTTATRLISMTVTTTISATDPPSESVTTKVSTKSNTSTENTNLTTEKGPVGLTSEYIALIAIFGSLGFVLILATLTYICQRHMKIVEKGVNGSPDKDKEMRTQKGLSVHRPESNLLLDGYTRTDTQMATFNTERKVETLGCENPIFLEETKIVIDKGDITDDEKVQTDKIGANDTETLPSRASLVIANEKSTNEQAVENADDAKTQASVKEANGPDTTDSAEKDEPLSDGTPDAESPKDEEQSSIDQLKEENRPQSGTSYKSVDMDTALQAVGDELAV